jgi:lipoate-protein ligase A
MAIPKIHFIALQGVSIFEQLQLEEALLRTEDKSFCLVNFGSPRAIVMGISGQPDKLLHREKVALDQIPVIQRFSGGGTVIVDEGTLFITFIISKEHVAIQAFPEAIHRWAADLYTAAWNIPGFHYRENDYVIGDRKCGGNAQYIKKDRWLHHTSFLWDYREENMEYLLLPFKRPQYRQDRTHKEFLCRLKDWAPNPDTLIAQLQTELVKRLYIEPFDVKNRAERPHRKSARLIPI